MQKFHVKMMLFAAVVAGVAVADEAFQCEFGIFKEENRIQEKLIMEKYMVVVEKKNGR